MLNTQYTPVEFRRDHSNNNLKQREITIKANLKNILEKNDPVILSITVNNVGTEIIQKGAKFYFKEGSFTFSKTIIIHQDIGIAEKLKLQEISIKMKRLKFKDINPVIFFNVKASDGGDINCEQKSIILKSEQICGFLRPCFTINRTINVLFYGCKLSGKSSLINSLFTAINSEPIEIATVIGESVRTTFTSYQLFHADKNNINSLNFTFWETCGLPRLEPNDLQYFCNGYVNENFNLSEIDKAAFGKHVANNQQTISERNVDVVVLVIEASQIVKPKFDAVINQLNLTVKNITGKIPILVITKKDKLHNKALLSGIKLKFLTHTCDDRKRQKDFKHDMKAIQILYHIFKAGMNK